MHILEMQENNSVHKKIIKKNGEKESEDRNMERSENNLQDQRIARSLTRYPNQMIIQKYTRFYQIT